MSPADRLPGSPEPAAPPQSTAPASSEERALTARVALGDREAFATLLRPHLARALLLARRLLRNAADAEDLVQDAALRALERFEQFDRSRAFGPWFLRLLMNLGLHQHEKIKRRTHEPLELLPAIADTTADPDAREFWTAFNDAVDRLTPRQRSVLLLFDVDGYTGAEIAALLDISPENVRWHLHAARRALRTPLQAYRSDSTTLP